MERNQRASTNAIGNNAHANKPSSSGRLSNVFDSQRLNQQNSKTGHETQFSQLAGAGSTGSTGMQSYHNKQMMKGGPDQAQP